MFTRPKDPLAKYGAISASKLIMTVMDDGPSSNIRIHEFILMGRKRREEGREKRGREKSRERKLFCTIKDQLINTEGITELENHHLTTILAATNLGKMGNRYPHSLKVASHRFCINHRRK